MIESMLFLIAILVMRAFAATIADLVYQRIHGPFSLRPSQLRRSR